MNETTPTEEPQGEDAWFCSPAHPQGLWDNYTGPSTFLEKMKDYSDQSPKITELHPLDPTDHQDEQLALDIANSRLEVQFSLIDVAYAALKSRSEKIDKLEGALAQRDERIAQLTQAIEKHSGDDYGRKLFDSRRNTRRAQQEATHWQKRWEVADSELDDVRQVNQELRTRLSAAETYSTKPAEAPR